MSDFVYDGTPLPYPKDNKNPLPPGADPAKYVAKTDWNTVCQATVDLRTAMTAGKFHGLAEQASTPASPPAGVVYLFSRNVGGFSQLCALFSNNEVAVLAETQI